MYPERRARRLLAAYPRTIPIVIFILIAAITALSIYSIERSERESDLAKLREQAQVVASALERRGAVMSSYLRAGAALFGTMEEVNPQVFDRFVGNLRADTSGGSSDGVGWAPLLRRDEIDAFSRQYKEYTGQEFRIFPEVQPNDQVIVPVTFLRPKSDRNRRAIGFNMASDPQRLRAIEEAIESNGPVATGQLVLKQEVDEEAPGFMVYMPVRDMQSTGNKTKGLIYAPFNAEQFLQSAIKPETRGSTGLRLYDRKIEPERLLAELSPTRYTGVTTSTIVTVANHDMVLVAESARGNSLSPLSMATLLFGIMVACLLMLLSRLLARQTIEDERRFAWLEEQNSIRNSLTRELNHRVKNTLANVLSIMALTKRRAASLDDFADSLEGRIRALSATHDLLTQSEWGTTPIRDLVEAELAPYAHQSEAMLELDGPDVEIAPNDALSLGLAVHELATNAAKYGALSRAGGKVSVTWKKIGEECAQLTWKESGGPNVEKPTRAGFGTNLIEKIVANELRNPVDLQFLPGGVVCNLKIPLRKPTDFVIRAG